MVRNAFDSSIETQRSLSVFFPEDLYFNSDCLSWTEMSAHKLQPISILCAYVFLKGEKVNGHFVQLVCSWLQNSEGNQNADFSLF